MSTQPAKKRIEFIDLAKGVCILLVIFSHSACEGHYPLSLMRMPLYFVLSGLFFKDYGGYLQTIVKKINKLIIPCLFFYAIAVAVTVAICIAVGSTIDINITDIFTKTAFHNIYLWFLISLFWTNIAFLILVRNLKKDTYIFIGIVILVLVGVYFNEHNLRLPLFMDSVFFSLPYFFFGNLLHKTHFIFEKDSNLKFMLCLISLLAIALTGSFLFGPQNLDMRVGVINGNLLIIYITSISYVLALLLIVKRIRHIPVISYAGRYSLILLGLHFPVQYVFMLIYKNIGINPTAILYFIPMVGIPLLVIPLLVRYAPYFTAQKDLIPSHVVVGHTTETSN